MIVNLPYRFSGLPLISIKNFFNISKHKKRITKEIMGQMLNGGRQFPLKKNKLLISLYNQFFKYCEYKFNKIDVLKEPEIWCLCTNKDNWKSYIHDHIETSTINAVYYLNVPQIDYKKVGCLKLFHNNKWFSYLPSNNELLIFPNYLKHDTEYHKTDDFRISINMEILCNNKINWNLND